MGMPAPSWDPRARESAAAARRRRRRRLQRLMLWLLACVTTAVLVVIGLFIKDISTVPTIARPVVLSASTRTVSGGTASRAARHLVSPRRTPSPAASPPQLADTASGLSYRLLPAPWQRGCPVALSTPMFSWSAGENAVAGHVAIGGSTVDWHGLACSGQLQEQFTYAGPADLQQAAIGLAATVDPAYYGGVGHYTTVQDNTPMQVSGHQAWMIEFLVHYYPYDAGLGVTWSSELGAVVVVDRGTGQAPAVFYVSVPANLGTGNVTVLVDSLRLGG